MRAALQLLWVPAIILILLGIASAFASWNTYWWFENRSVTGGACSSAATADWLPRGRGPAVRRRLIEGTDACMRQLRRFAFDEGFECRSGARAEDCSRGLNIDEDIRIVIQRHRALLEFERQ